MLLDAGFAVLSEESGRSGDGDRIVVIDPLDGSTNASRGIPWFATSLCVVDDDGPAVALVANQATGERLEAARGQGAWSGSRRLCDVGRGGASTGPSSALNSLPDGSLGMVAGRGRSVPCALDLGLVAAGSLDAYIDLCSDLAGPWDYLGGVLLLIREAGGAVADAFDRDLVALEHAARRTPIAGGDPGAARRYCSTTVDRHERGGVRVARP